MKTVAIVFAGLAGIGGAQACEMTLSQGEIDYGVLNRTTLKASDGSWHLAPRHLTLQVHCPQPEDMQLFYRAQAASPDAFALGQGRYRLELGQALLDGEPVALGGAVDGRALTSLTPDRGAVPLKGGARLKGRQFSVQMKVVGEASEAALRVSDLTHWQAAGVFDIAGQQRDLSLRAGFAPASCTPRLGEGGRVDFGRIPAQRLSPHQPTLFTRSVALTINCEGPTRFALTARENRAGSARTLEGLAQGSLFGLGRTALNTPVGAYRARVAEDSQGDGRPLVALYGEPGGLSWQPAPANEGAALHHDGRLLGFTHGDHQPAAISQFSGNLAIDLFVAPLSELKLSEEVMLEGAATVEIVYL
ncbi:hypothetical protein PMM47T1_04894 [Pseudomonas sp. M47T1]|uniref:DUF1120 domain-containing protein n=2 Tax=unclassified Pseudomonas TaxID=196821 RepID=UPI000260828B|nr:DUF1120 domain-containing protein [Pseudomonas sp. M47T1]EIK97821.1 hypothetical protein PMM47T1_04894 [Pseudomonas sp. M47T1]